MNCHFLYHLLKGLGPNDCTTVEKQTDAKSCSKNWVPKNLMIYEDLGWCKKIKQSTNHGEAQTKYQEVRINCIQKNMCTYDRTCAEGHPQKKFGNLFVVQYTTNCCREIWGRPAENEGYWHGAFCKGGIWACHFVEDYSLPFCRGAPWYSYTMGYPNPSMAISKMV